MKRLPGFAVLTTALTLAVMRADRPVQAKFIDTSQPVPVRRLIQNVEAYTRTHPKDAQGFYTLGRLHSLAFARGENEIRVRLEDHRTKQPLALPGWPPYSTPLEKPSDALQQRRKAALGHLKQGLNLYRKAVGMNAENGLYWLSYGWMIEQGAAFFGEVEAPFLSKPGKASARAWREQALRAYIKAFDLSRKHDAERNDILEGMDVIVSQEAGHYLLRLAQDMPNRIVTEAKRSEIEQHLKEMNNKPHAITPIIFPLRGPQPLRALLARDKQTAFDLDGTGRQIRWPWVRPETGILVWDPDGTGRITSGRQVFGSLTWQILWRNGYEALAALDDDKNGWLEKRELKGLACWQDKNSNGKADPGEVIPLTALGVVRLAAYPIGKHAGTLFHPYGVQWRDGARLPSYDWTPVSIAAPKR